MFFECFFECVLVPSVKKVWTLHSLYCNDNKSLNPCRCSLSLLLTPVTVTYSDNSETMKMLQNKI